MKNKNVYQDKDWHKPERNLASLKLWQRIVPEN